jgi:hypothetical protein
MFRNVQIVPPKSVRFEFTADGLTHDVEISLYLRPASMPPYHIFNMAPRTACPQHMQSRQQSYLTANHSARDAMRRYIGEVTQVTDLSSHVLLQASEVFEALDQLDPIAYAEYRRRLPRR